MRRTVSYESVKEIDTNKQRNDIFWKGIKPTPRFQIISYRNESYGEFLRRNPNASKKQRIIAIQRFYNNLLK